MNHEISRRDFGRRTSLAVGSLIGVGGLSARQVLAQPADEKTPRLVLLGLNALARSHTRDYFVDGHRGAALVAAHFLCEEEKIEEAGRARIAELFELNWGSTELCKPFPDARPDSKGIAKIGAALIDGGETLRQVGHNAIFAMLAIKGFCMIPSAATPERIDGVCRLIRSMTPWRDELPDKNVDPPPFSDRQAASRYVLQQASEAVDRFVGFGQGFAGHMLTFGHSLIELAAMGEKELAESCRTAFRKYVTIVRQGPRPDDKRFKDHQQSSLRPNQSKYWKERGDRAVDIGHVFKYPYAYYNLLQHANDAALARDWDQKAYHVF